MCRPWQPTSAKKLDRKALRSGPSPWAIRPANSLISSSRNAKPSRPVTSRARPGSRAGFFCSTAEARHATGEGGEQQAARLQRDAGQVEHSGVPTGPPAVAPDSTGVGGEEGREHHKVGQQEDPEAIADDDPLGRRAAVAMAVAFGMRAVAMVVVADAMGVVAAVGGGGVAHAERPLAAGLSSRSAAVGAVDARHLLGRDLLLRHVAPGERHEGGVGPEQAKRPLSHQICQIMAKPITTAKKAVTKPVALFFGISMDW